MSEPLTIKETKVGFFALCQTSSQETGFVGAILILDEQGSPLEFKCTEAIRPTNLQRTLYGQRMKATLTVQLTGIPLLGNIGNTLDVLIVNDPLALEIRPKVNIPIVLAAAETGGNSQTHSAYPGDNHIPVLQRLPYDLNEPFSRIAEAVKVLGQQNEKFR